jgi:hypothetical protein
MTVLVTDLDPGFMIGEYSVSRGYWEVLLRLIIKACHYLKDEAENRLKIL